MPVSDVDKLKFSVLMPVYIKENPVFLAAALHSIMKEQSVLPDEVVIVEDGPITPELDNVLGSFESAYADRFKRYKLAVNQGMGKAMNHGLQKASFGWIARMDSDDIAKPDRFETQVKFLRSNPSIDVLGSAIEEFITTPGDLRSFRLLPAQHVSIVQMMKKRTPINHMTVMYRRDIAVKAGGYWDERNFEDYNLWYEMKKCGAKFHNLQDVTVDVRIGNGMVERRSGYRYFIDEKLLLTKFYNDKFISFFEYLVLYAAKLLLRILPVGLLKIVYKYFLRKSL